MPRVTSHFTYPSQTQHSHRHFHSFQIHAHQEHARPENLLHDARHPIYHVVPSSRSLSQARFHAQISAHCPIHEHEQDDIQQRDHVHHFDSEQICDPSPNHVHCHNLNYHQNHNLCHNHNLCRNHSHYHNHNHFLNHNLDHDRDHYCNHGHSYNQNYSYNSGDVLNEAPGRSLNDKSNRGARENSRHRILHSDAAIDRIETGSHTHFDGIRQAVDDILRGLGLSPTAVSTAASVAASIALSVDVIHPSPEAVLTLC